MSLILHPTILFLCFSSKFIKIGQPFIFYEKYAQKIAKLDNKAKADMLPTMRFHQTNFSISVMQLLWQIGPFILMFLMNRIHYFNSPHTQLINDVLIINTKIISSARQMI